MFESLFFWKEERITKLLRIIHLDVVHNIILLMLYDIHRRSLSVGPSFILNKHESEYFAKGFKEFKNVSC